VGGHSNKYPSCTKPRPLAAILMKSIFIFTIFCLLLSCADKIKNVTPPDRLKNIPPTSFWVGGSGGGNWFLIRQIHSHNNAATIDIYNDQDGNLVLSKEFVLICSLDKPDFIESQYFKILDSLQNQILGFDGEKIILKTAFNKKNCVLQ